MTETKKDLPEVLDDADIEQAAGGHRYELKNVMITSYDVNSSDASNETQTFTDKN